MPKSRTKDATTVLLRGVRVSTDKQANPKKCSLLIVIKDRHRYILKYDPARPIVLFDLLLDYAQDKAYNLTSFDAMTLIERIRGRKPGASAIELSEGEPAVGQDLTIEDIADIGGGEDTTREF